MVPDRIEREIVIDAPLEVVWAVVTAPEHVGGWFSDSAELDLRPGGKGTLTWNEHGSFLLRIEKVDPPHSVAYRWARPAGAEPRAGNSTLVEFILSEEGERTRLRVVESGFAELEEAEEEKTKHFQENTQGWERELDELRGYVSKRVGASSRR
jgi:uncharacterized protein YndB with AHSA1/START domain